MIGFFDLELDSNESLNSKIFNLELKIYKGVLSKRLLNNHVFKDLKNIIIRGDLDELKNDTFFIT